MPGVGELKVGVGEYMKIDYKRKKKRMKSIHFGRKKTGSPCASIRKERRKGCSVWTWWLGGEESGRSDRKYTEGEMKEKITSQLVIFL